MLQRNLEQLHQEFIDIYSPDSNFWRKKLQTLLDGFKPSNSFSTGLLKAMTM